MELTYMEEISSYPPERVMQDQRNPLDPRALLLSGGNLR